MKKITDLFFIHFSFLIESPIKPKKSPRETAVEGERGKLSGSGGVFKKVINQI